jgi:hypothetical protein
VDKQVAELIQVTPNELKDAVALIEVSHDARVQESSQHGILLRTIFGRITYRNLIFKLSGIMEFRVQ